MNGFVEQQPGLTFLVALAEDVLFLITAIVGVLHPHANDEIGVELPGEVRWRNNRRLIVPVERHRT